MLLIWVWQTVVCQLRGQRAENAGEACVIGQRCLMSKLLVLVNHHKIAPRRIQTFESTSRFRQPRGWRVTIFPILRIFCKKPFETIATLAFCSAHSHLHEFSRSAEEESAVLHPPSGDGSWARQSVVSAGRPEEESASRAPSTVLRRWLRLSERGFHQSVILRLPDRSLETSSETYGLRRLSRSICRSSSPSEILVSTSLPRRSTNTIVGSVAIPNC